MPMHRRRLARGLLSLVLLLWLGIIPVVGEPAPWTRGELIDVGGHLLHIHCQGEGMPVVVLDAGLGGASSDWRKVQPELAKSNRTCIYDRAGYGHSDSGPLPRTSARIAAELRTLLLRAELPPPYLLAGHSFGGFNVRLFAGLFPDETAGVVLVDSPHEAQADALFEEGILGFLDPQGWLRSLWSPELLSSLPEESAAIAEMLGMPAKTWYTILNEASAFDASAQELAATPMPADIPVGVLMHGRSIFPEGVIGDGLERDWLRANRELVRAQRRGYFAIAPQSGHLIHVEQPELIVEMVRKVLEMGGGPN
ncbi:MAG: alpha/beta hydrolase [Chromatiaceae bacterium]|nr:alpha/beta hydrolase [Chromatiaceae bacterium]